MEDRAMMDHSTTIRAVEVHLERDLRICNPLEFAQVGFDQLRQKFDCIHKSSNALYLLPPSSEVQRYC